VAKSLLVNIQRSGEKEVKGGGGGGGKIRE